MRQRRWLAAQHGRALRWYWLRQSASRRRERFGTPVVGDLVVVGEDGALYPAGDPWWGLVIGFCRDADDDVVRVLTRGGIRLPSVEGHTITGRVFLRGDGLLEVQQ